MALYKYCILLFIILVYLYHFDVYVLGSQEDGIKSDHQITIVFVLFACVECNVVVAKYNLID